MQCYIPATGIVRITDTLQYIPKAFVFPKTTTEDYLQQAIGDIIAIMKNPPKTLPFLSYIATFNATHYNTLNLNSFSCAMNDPGVSSH